MKTIMIDVDGTLVKGTVDKKFTDLKNTKGFEAAMQWYCNNTTIEEMETLEINWELVSWLKEWKAEGYSLVIWTNRGEAQREATMKSISSIIDMFDGFIFGNGVKKNMRIADAFAVDNEIKNLEEGDILVETF